MFYFQNELVPMLPILIPGVDETTVIGYSIVSLFQLFVAVVGAIGISATDIFYVILLLNTPAMAKLIEIECKNLNRSLTEYHNRNIFWKYRFRNILLLHLDVTS